MSFVMTEIEHGFTSSHLWFDLVDLINLDSRSFQDCADASRLLLCTVEW
jgi:hypothetical protein